MCYIWYYVMHTYEVVVIFAGNLQCVIRKGKLSWGHFCAGTEQQSQKYLEEECAQTQIFVHTHICSKTEICVHTRQQSQEVKFDWKWVWEARDASCDLDLYLLKSFMFIRLNYSTLSSHSTLFLQIIQLFLFKILNSHQSSHNLPGPINRSTFSNSVKNFPELW